MLEREGTPSYRVVELRLVTTADDFLNVTKQWLHQLAALLRLDGEAGPQIPFVGRNIAVRLEHQRSCVALFLGEPPDMARHRRIAIARVEAVIYQQIIGEKLEHP